MVYMSKTEATTISFAFTASNLVPTGYTAQMTLNGQNYTISPVADGATATVSISTAAAQAISTDYFFADMIVLRSDSSVAVKLCINGKVVSRALSSVEANGNVVPVLLMPEFKVPIGKTPTSEIALPATMKKTVGGVVKEYEVDIVDDEHGIDFTIEAK